MLMDNRENTVLPITTFSCSSVGINVESGMALVYINKQIKDKNVRVLSSPFSTSLPVCCPILNKPLLMFINNTPLEYYVNVFM